jgi:BMFP domain-containing protein YqiC
MSTEGHSKEADVRFDANVFESIGSQAHSTLQKLQKTRRIENKIREITKTAFDAIEASNKD